MVKLRFGGERVGSVGSVCGTISVLDTTRAKHA